MYGQEQPTRYSQYQTFRDDPKTQTDDWLAKNALKWAYASDMTTSILGFLVSLGSIIGTLVICLMLPPEESTVKLAAIAALGGGGSLAGSSICKIQPKHLSSHPQRR